MQWEPQVFEHITAHDHAIERLRRSVSSTLHLGKRFGSCLIKGFPASGKSAISRVVCQELGYEAEPIYGEWLFGARDLAGRLAPSEDGNMVVLEDLHLLPPQEQFRLSRAFKMISDNGVSPLLIANTIVDHRSCKSLVKQFDLVIELPRPKQAWIEKTIQIQARARGMQIDEDARAYLAKVSYWNLNAAVALVQNLDEGLGDDCRHVTMQDAVDAFSCEATGTHGTEKLMQIMVQAIKVAGDSIDRDELLATIDWPLDLFELVIEQLEVCGAIKESEGVLNFSEANYRGPAMGLRHML